MLSSAIGSVLPDGSPSRPLLGVELEEVLTDDEGDDDNKKDGHGENDVTAGEYDNALKRILAKAVDEEEKSIPPMEKVHAVARCKKRDASMDVEDIGTFMILEDANRAVLASLDKYDGASWKGSQDQNINLVKRTLYVWRYSEIHESYPALLMIRKRKRKQPKQSTTYVVVRYNSIFDEDEEEDFIGDFSTLEEANQAVLDDLDDSGWEEVKQNFIDVIYPCGPLGENRRATPLWSTYMMISSTTHRNRAQSM